MKWIAISGSWRKFNKNVENDVRRIVRGIFEKRDGIISGGALGVDYFATDEALKIDTNAKRIKVFLPVSLELYSSHYRKRAKEGIITNFEAEDLISQLEKIKSLNPKALVEDKDNTEITQEKYFARIEKIVEASDKLIAFHVNQSEGTGFSIKKAYEKGIPVKIYSYSID